VGVGSMTGSRGVVAVSLVVAGLVGCAAPRVAAPPAHLTGDAPRLAAARATTSSVPSSTTSSVAAPVTRPIAVPKDPYAPEPVRRIGTMEIPRIGLDHPIYEGITLNNIDHGPSHWPGSALPGQAGNAVFAGHRVTHSHPFRRIAELVAGDVVVFDIGGSRSAYRVVGAQVVTPRDTWIANPTPTSTATLFACHPPGSARFRYVVHLELVTGGGTTSSATPPASM
jgi:sortase A